MLISRLEWFLHCTSQLKDLSMTVSSIYSVSGPFQGSKRQLHTFSYPIKIRSSFTAALVLYKHIKLSTTGANAFHKDVRAKWYRGTREPRRKKELGCTLRQSFCHGSKVDSNRCRSRSDLCLQCPSLDPCKLMTVSDSVWDR